MRIRQLAPAVANQIAAGEVIERPASVVKELLENAFDAQADTIIIDIGYGGLNQIRISDNGLGIPAEDLPLAIAAHATSKISQLEDLYSIASMGFRGEALASIASISRLSISSKPADQEHAMVLSTQDQSFAIHPCARSQGTTIDVRDIFFNAPVRKKFLKGERGEFQAIERVVKGFALSAPAISLSLIHNGKAQLHLPAAHCDKTRLARIRKLLGKPFVEQACHLDVQQEGLQLQGWVANKHYQRSQNDKLWVYVNNRMVKDKLINHAIKQAYEEILYPGRHPACLLYLSIEPEEVDVNVHPTKHELRFQQPRWVHDFIRSSIQQVLAHSDKEKDQDYPLNLAEGREVLAIYEPSKFCAHLPASQAKTLPLPSSRGKGNWVTINARFVLIFIQSLAYLVDIVALQRDYLSASLAEERLPLASRPLLVPITHSLSRAIAINPYQEILQQLGMEVDLASENAVFVRSIPIQVPHLDINPFLRAVFSLEQPNVQQLGEWLAVYQSFNAEQAMDDEKEAIMAYIQSLPPESPVLKSCCKELSPIACVDFLNG